MATNVVFNGVSYSVPAEADDGWGPDLSAYLISIASNSFQKTGGSFTLTAEADFGASYGLKSAYYTSKGTNPASSGAMRLANAEGIYWRNAANSGNLGLVVNSSNALQFNGATLLASGLIVNADIDAAAAIAYSKLNLAGSIVNADISNSAAIAYSKLNLSTSIVNADISASAAIAYSKLNLTGLIVDADIGASAAIALSKLAAVTASRALVSDGSGFVSASSVTSTELGYVSGVTSAIQTQLDAKVAKSLTTTTGDMIYASGASTPARLPIGSSGQVLKTVGGVPTWATFSGGINYLSANPDAESDTAGWATYADAAGTSPVNGTAGSANITWTRTTSSPLRGSGSFLFTKDAANRQGEGVSYDFTIDAADKAKVLTISFDYIVGSGTFVAGTGTTDSDVTVWIYDVTNSLVIQPSSIKLFSNSSTTAEKYSAQFQTASNSTSYRLIFHVGSTSASAYTLKFDNFNVGPSNYVYGTPVTDFSTYTPTIAGFGTVGSQTTMYKRVGDVLQVKGYFTVGTPSATNASITIPSGLAIDYTKLTTAAGQAVGIANKTPSGAAAVWTSGQGLVVFADGSDTAKVYLAYQGSSNVLQKVGGSTIGVASENVSYYFEVPITGWSSSVQMSDSADTRVVSAKYTGVNTTTFTTSGVVADFNTKAHDTHGAVTTGSSWKFTAPVSGIYRVSVGFLPSSTVGLNLVLRKNASNVFRLAQIAASATGTIQSGTTTIQLNAGDYIDLIGYTDSSTTTFANDATFNYIDVERISGPSAIAASETIYAKYRPSGSRTPTTVKAINYDTKVDDTHSAVTVASGDAAGWKFTAPAFGFYQVNLTFFTSSGAASTTYYIYKNGSSDTALASGVSSGVVGAVGSVKLNAGDYIDIRSDSTPTVSSALTEVSIFRIK